MTARRVPTAAVLVVAAVLAIGPAVGTNALTAGATGPSASSAPPGDGTPTSASDASKASLGASVSSFMQASAADAAGEVESGMFSAKFNDTNASAQARLVHARVDDLTARLGELREARAELLNATDDGNLSVAERAKAAWLTARIDALAEAINGTERAAERAGVNVTRLDELRTNARNLTGPEVAAIATGLVDQDRGNGHGPPENPAGNDVPAANVSDEENGGPPENPGPESDESGPGASDGDDPPRGNESDGAEPS